MALTWRQSISFIASSLAPSSGRATRPGVGLVEPVERVERLRQAPGREREEALFAQLLVQPEPFCSELGCGGGIAGQELDPDGLEGGDVREQGPPAALGQLRTRLGEDRARLVEATEHRQRPAR